MAREAALRLIHDQYSAVHGASPAFLYPHLLAEGSATRTRAACGYRRASSGPLFLESYLDHPIEQALSRTVGREVPREDIVEIGNLASDNAPAMITLWAAAANDLGRESEFVVAVLTVGLRQMFGKLGIALQEIAPAVGEKLGDQARDWGRYYSQDPIICTGLIADGQHQLARFSRRGARA